MKVVQGRIRPHQAGHHSATPGALAFGLGAPTEQPAPDVVVMNRLPRNRAGFTVLGRRDHRLGGGTGTILVIEKGAQGVVGGPDRIKSSRHGEILQTAGKLVIENEGQGLWHGTLLDRGHGNSSLRGIGRGRPVGRDVRTSRTGRNVASNTAGFQADCPAGRRRRPPAAIPASAAASGGIAGPGRGAAPDRGAAHRPRPMAR